MAMTGTYVTEVPLILLKGSAKNHYVVYEDGKQEVFKKKREFDDYDIEFFSRSVRQTTYLGSRLAVDDLPGSRLVNAESSEITDFKVNCKNNICVDQTTKIRHKNLPKRSEKSRRLSGSPDDFVRRLPRSPDDFQPTNSLLSQPCLVEISKHLGIVSTLQRSQDFIHLTRSVTNSTTTQGDTDTQAHSTWKYLIQSFRLPFTHVQ
ncbi:hypothetical protein YC2023_070148 [Brassica napus]